MYHYTSCGLDNIYLKNGFDIQEGLEGKGVSIHDIDSLHLVIAKGIIDKSGPLSGREFRFLRIEMDFSQKVVGDLMDKSDQAVANWEKGKGDIHVLADKAIRDLYMESIGESHVTNILSKLRDIDRQIHEMEFQLSETEKGWQLEQCA